VLEWGTNSGVGRVSRYTPYDLNPSLEFVTQWTVSAGGSPSNQPLGMAAF
jgi:hypothetical protein